MMQVIEQTKHFSRSELQCRVSGNCKMSDLFMYKIESLREEFGKPMRVSSAYRDPVKHPIEVRKETPGYHAQGRAMDVLVSGNDAWRLVALAVEYDLSIGVSQKGAHEHRFIHLDDREDPTIWSY